ncbi:MAG: dockerin type I repeat-containing protein, partial [Candidatus Zixiibacteriota bacterium]
FIQALSIDSLIPTIDADTIRDPFTPRLRALWTPRTPPGVATFKINEHAVTTSLFKSIYPSQSIQQDDIVGIRRDFPALNTSAFTFGYHLWYMDSADARNLIESIFNDSPSVLSGQSHIEPSFFRIVEANSIEPRYALIYIGNLMHGRNVGEIDPASILVNNTVTPVTTEILPSVNGYNGDVLRIEVALSDFLRTYMPVWDTLHGDYIVDAGLNDGLSLQVTGEVTITGHRRGDINSDDAVNILDLTLLVDYLFRGRRLPLPTEPADLDANGAVNILDLTRLVDYIFRSEGL